MRLVDVCAFYCESGGGVRTYAERKLRAAEACGVEAVIVAPGETTGTAMRSPSGRVVTLASPRLPVDRRYRYFADETALHQLLDELAPDVVEASSPWASAAMVARWQGSAVRSLVMHADPLSAYAYRWFGGVAPRAAIDRWFGWYWRHLRRLDQGFDIVVSASAGLSKRLVEGGLRRVSTVPMGVEPGIFDPSLRDEGLRADLLASCGLPPEATLLLGIGRYAPEKRWPMVIEAAAAAGARHALGLVLVGGGRDRPRVVKAAGDNPHVTVGRAVADRAGLARLMASGDALVHGCEAETFCMAAAEARASGLPLIVPDEGGAADQAVRGRDRIYRSRSTRALADAIDDFVRADPAGVRAAAAAAAGGVRTMDQHFDSLFGTYRELLARQSGVGFAQAAAALTPVPAMAAR